MANWNTWHYAGNRDYSDDEEDIFLVSDDDEALQNWHFDCYWFAGSAAGLQNYSDYGVRRCTSMEELLTCFAAFPTGDSVCEIFGGEARTSQFLVKHRVRGVGPNFDLVCHIDLTKQEDQNKVWQYLEMSRCQITILAPPCTPFGPLMYINRLNATAAWNQSLQLCLPVAKFTGEVALYQLNHDRDYFAEQPNPSTLFEVEPWPQVRQHPRSCRELTDQCQSGARTKDG